MIQARQLLCPENKKSIKFPYSMTPTRIVVHNTANDASANNEITYMNRNDNQVSFHFAVDDHEVVQGLPTDVNGWHAEDGAHGKGNREGIGIEICYSKSGGERFEAAEKLAAQFIAQLLTQYGWGIEQVTKHQDYSGKYCPHRTLDMGWSRFLDMIRAQLGQAAPETGDTYTVSQTVKGYYTAADALSGTDPRSVVAPGVYYIYNTSGGAVNVTKTVGVPGAWIKATAPEKSVEEVAQEVIRGDWGNGNDRIQRLTAAGYNAQEVQSRVNAILSGNTAAKKSVDELAREVIRGDWGNGNDRKNRLTAAGYDYSAVQRRVNELL